MGDSKGVSVVEVLVTKGASIQVDDPLITLESDKASMDVPSPVAGVVESIAIKKGDEAAAGTLIATVTVTEGAAATAPVPAAAPAPASAATPAPVATPAPARRQGDRRCARHGGQRNLVRRSCHRL
jgi:pyruvate/2-oxoglutarate dehydrogenase complex dihydrolipoamide acyltransferase (E2) component